MIVVYRTAYQHIPLVVIESFEKKKDTTDIELYGPILLFYDTSKYRSIGINLTGF